jgi:hypothetical protein
VQKWKTFCALRTFLKTPSPLHFGAHIVLARFVNPHKVCFKEPNLALVNYPQNECVLKMKTIFFCHGRLKHSFSQVEGNSDL